MSPTVSLGAGHLNTLSTIEGNVVLKTSKAAFVAAIVALTLSVAPIAKANTWKMEPLIHQVPVLQEAQDLQEDGRQEFLCLALTVYHEARGVSHTGKLAVAHVVLNRTRSGKFPTTICGVVWERDGGRPQFSWTSRPVGAIIPRDRDAWDECQRVALEAMQSPDGTDPTGGATHFYNSHQVKPRWAYHVQSSWREGVQMFVRPLGL